MIGSQGIPWLLGLASPVEDLLYFLNMLLEPGLESLSPSSGVPETTFYQLLLQQG